MPKTILVALLSVTLVCSIIVQPDASFQASLQGLAVWWNMVFPGLLPFLVLYEIMLAFGLIHALGILLSPLTTRFFRLPGEAGIALTLGFLGGYTSGTDATAALRKRRLITRSQGERLLAYSHLPNPLFMLVVVGAGFLHRPMTGVIIAAAVWLSALWLLHASSLIARKAGSVTDSSSDIAAAGLLRSAAAAMLAAREQDGRTFGTVLGEAVSSGVQKLLVIGGYILFASVLAKLCEPLLAPLLHTAPFLGSALFESHLGAYAASDWQQHASAASGTAAIAAVLAWSGIGGILQAAHSASGTDLRLLPFVARRLLHATHAALFAFLLWKPVAFLSQYISGSSYTLPAAAGHEGTNTASLAPFPYSTSDLPPIWDKSLITAGACLTACFLTAIILKQRRRMG